MARAELIFSSLSANRDLCGRGRPVAKPWQRRTAQSQEKFREALKLQSAQCRCTRVEHLNSKALSKKSLMKKPAQLIIRKLTTIGFVFLAVSVTTALRRHPESSCDRI